MTNLSSVERPGSSCAGKASAFLPVLLWAFQAQHAGWALFAALFFAPDVSMLGYLVNPRIGAVAYNAVHTTIVYGPLAGPHHDRADALGLHFQIRRRSQD